MKIPKSNANRNKEINMIIKARRAMGITPVFCIFDECQKLIQHGQKIRRNRCLKCEYFTMKIMF